MNKIQMDISSILNISFQTYAKDFTFIVNEEEFKTSRLISDLLSPIINNIHLSDPTIDKFTTNTRSRGHFNYIINLVNFTEIQIPEEEEDFIIEVIDQLGNDKITIINSKDDDELTVDNIISHIKRHKSHSNVFKARLNQELEFISKHFFELPEERTKELENLEFSTLLTIFNSEKLLLRNEDQLLQIVNELYSKDEEYSILYETIHFLNVSSEKMNEFLSIYKYEDMNCSTWKKLCERLSCEIQIQNQSENKRYKNENQNQKQKIKSIEFQPTNNNTINGIINHLRKQTNKNIEQEIDFQSSSVHCGYVPKNVSNYDDSSSLFYSNNEEGSWISFKFKNHRIIPTDYQIKSYGWIKNNEHPKSWVIECSNDNEGWEIVDEENNCSYLNGGNLVHTFHINKNNNKEFQYIRMRSTGPDCFGCNYLAFSQFEIYGTLI